MISISLNDLKCDSKEAMYFTFNILAHSIIAQSVNDRNFLPD